ncbi:YfhO family protein [Acidobacterium sp. S8]|uniref:YfhO family protein n=1 Tax=Acidobacterium sp. S8 TaxID=1641854 RepID=UPI00131E14A0|nr:YfhO family protein [Acidobacterium sp. S8]
MRISFRFPHSLSSNATRHRRRRSLILACALIAALPLAWRGTSCGHDFDFHLQSWLEVVHHWREGVLYPHWGVSANYGAGEPRFVFYPPLSWLLGALLGLVLPWAWTPVAFTLIALIACGLSFFSMAREWMESDAAAVAACVYLLNPYMMFVAYERTAYGELLSAIWLPLLVLYGLRRQSSMLPLALIVATLWLTNAPAAVMGCYLLVLIVLVAAIQERSLMLIRRAAGAVALGLGLAAFYIVPAVYEERWVEIARAIGSGMRVEDSFLFGHTGEAFHDQVLRTASWIAVAMVLTAIVAAIFSRSKPNPLRRSFLASLFTICVLLLPFSDFLWRHVPELQFLQFPWRWLLVLGIVMAALIGLALRGSFLQADTRKTILVRAIAMLSLAVIMTSLAASIVWQPCDDEDNIAAQQATFRNGGFEGTDEYTAANSDNGDIQRQLPLVRVLSVADVDQADSSIAENPEWVKNAANTIPAQIEIQRWKTENKTVEITTQSSAYAVFRLMDYPAWQVRVNGQSLVLRPHRDDGLMTVPIPDGRSTITIAYVATRDVELGRALSLLAICIAIAVFVQTKRRRNLQLS